MSTLKDLCAVEYGKALPEKLRIPGVAKVYGSSGEVGTHKEALYKEPLIVVGRKGNISGVHKVDGPSWVIDTAYAIKPSNRLDRDYLYYFLKFNTQHLANSDSSTAIPSLAREILYSLEIKALALEAQRNIVKRIDSLFAEIDAGIQELHQAQEMLEFYKQSVLNAAIRGQLVPQDPNDEPASEALVRTCAEKNVLVRERKVKKEKALPQVDQSEAPFVLPKGWTWARMVNVAAGVPHAMAIGPFGSNLKVQDYKNEGVPLVFVRNIRSGTFGGEKAKFVTHKKAMELASHSIKGGDVLVTKMGEPPGDACVYPTDAPDAIITADCIKIRVNNTLISSEYLSHVVNSPVVKPQILGKTQGVAQKKVSLERFREILIPLPPRKEQNRILAILEQCLSEQREGESTLSCLAPIISTLKQAILKAAFEGTLL